MAFTFTPSIVSQNLVAFLANPQVNTTNWQAALGDTALVLKLLPLAHLQWRALETGKHGSEFHLHGLQERAAEAIELLPDVFPDSDREHSLLDMVELGLAGALGVDSPLSKLVVPSGETIDYLATPIFFGGVFSFERGVVGVISFDTRIASQLGSPFPMHISNLSPDHYEPGRGYHSLSSKPPLSWTHVLKNAEMPRSAKKPVVNKNEWRDRTTSANNVTAMEFIPNSRTLKAYSVAAHRDGAQADGTRTQYLQIDKRWMRQQDGIWLQQQGIDRGIEVHLWRTTDFQASTEGILDSKRPQFYFLPGAVIMVQGPRMQLDQFHFGNYTTMVRVLSDVTKGPTDIDRFTGHDGLEILREGDELVLEASWTRPPGVDVTARARLGGELVSGLPTAWQIEEGEWQIAAIPATADNIDDIANHIAKAARIPKELIL